MKLKDFRKKMRKNVFTTREAHLIAFDENPKLLNLQLHQWKKTGDIISLKRGLFIFADAPKNIAEIASSLFAPSYFSLEYALSFYGILPEAVFTYTLISPMGTRRFTTPAGNFIYRKMKREAFTGFDPKTLMAEKEKALADYFYFNMKMMKPESSFWAESRIEVNGINFSKVLRYAKLFHSKRLTQLLKSLQVYATSLSTHR